MVLMTWVFNFPNSGGYLEGMAPNLGGSKFRFLKCKERGTASFFGKFSKIEKWSWRFVFSIFPCTVDISNRWHQIWIAPGPSSRISVSHSTYFFICGSIWTSSWHIPHLQWPFRRIFSGLPKFFISSFNSSVEFHIGITSVFKLHFSFQYWFN